MKYISFVNLIFCLALVWLPLTVPHASNNASAAAVIQATARVVPSLGLSAAPDKSPNARNIEAVDLSLWMTESDNLQLQVEADGRPLNFRLTAEESAVSARPVLARHRRRGQIRQVLQIDPLPDNVDTCTITIVDPTT